MTCGSVDCCFCSSYMRTEGCTCTLTHAPTHACAYACMCAHNPTRMRRRVGNSSGSKSGGSMYVQDTPPFLCPLALRPPTITFPHAFLFSQVAHSPLPTPSQYPALPPSLPFACPDGCLSAHSCAAAAMPALTHGRAATHASTETRTVRLCMSWPDY